MNKQYLSIVLRKKVHFNKKRNLRRYFWHFLSEYKVIEFFCRWFMYILNAFFSIQCVSVSFKKRYAVNNTIVKNSDNVNFQKSTFILETMYDFCWSEHNTFLCVFIFAVAESISNQNIVKYISIQLCYLLYLKEYMFHFFF